MAPATKPRPLTPEESAELWRYQSTRSPPPRIELLRALEGAHLAQIGVEIAEARVAEIRLSDRGRPAVPRLQRGDRDALWGLGPEEAQAALRARAAEDTLELRRSELAGALWRLETAERRAMVPGSDEARADADARAAATAAARLEWENDTVYGDRPAPLASSRIVR